MSKLEIINKFFFQLFFIRLTKHLKYDKDNNLTRSGWSFMYWVIPFTGWSSNFKYIGKQAKFLYL